MSFQSGLGWPYLLLRPARQHPHRVSDGLVSLRVSKGQRKTNRLVRADSATALHIGLAGRRGAGRDALGVGKRRVGAQARKHERYRPRQRGRPAILRF